MKIKKISSHIYKLEFWIRYKTSVWLIVHNKDVIIIDIGRSCLVTSIYNAAFERGDVKAVYLTHGDLEHAGGVNYLHKNYIVPIYTNEKDIEYAEGKRSFPGKRKEKEIVKPGILQSLGANNRAGKIILEEMGVSQYPTAGYLPGNTVYYHKTDNVLIAGDLFTSKKGKLTPPMDRFTADKNTALQDGVEILERLRPSLMTICHGDDLISPYKKISDLNLGS